jgi:hypothetical protein
MSDDWFESVIDLVLHGGDPHEVLAGVVIQDTKEQWYCEALKTLVRAHGDPEAGPGKLLKMLWDLGYPLHDVLHAAMMYETLLQAMRIADAVAAVLEEDAPLTEDEIAMEAGRLIGGVEDYLKTR